MNMKNSLQWRLPLLLAVTAVRWQSVEALEKDSFMKMVRAALFAQSVRVSCFDLFISLADAVCGVYYENLNHCAVSRLRGSLTGDTHGCQATRLSSLARIVQFQPLCARHLFFARLL